MERLTEKVKLSEAERPASQQKNLTADISG